MNIHGVNADRTPAATLTDRDERALLRAHESRIAAPLGVSRALRSAVRTAARTITCTFPRRHAGAGARASRPERPVRT